MQHASPMQTELKADSALATEADVEQEVKSPSSRKSTKQNTAKLKAPAGSNLVGSGSGTRNRSKSVMTGAPALLPQMKVREASGVVGGSGSSDALQPVVKAEVAASTKQEGELEESLRQAGAEQQEQEGQGSPVMPSRLRRKVFQMT